MSEPLRQIIVEKIYGEGWYVKVRECYPTATEILATYGPTKHKPSKARLISIQYKHFGGYACQVSEYA